jgi:hypothetical protein
VRRIALAIAGCILLAAVVVAAFGLSVPAAKADLPPGSVCLTPVATPGAGTQGYVLSATLPTAAPLNANGVCVVLSGTGNNNHWGQIVENSAGCLATPAAATPDADGSYVSADWGSTSCVRPGDSVTIRFWSGATIPTNPTVTWNLVGGTPAAGTALLQGPVGGVAELPGGSESLPANTESANSSLLAYAIILGMAVAAVVAGGWYVRRQRHG